ncbi:MAG: hypothetical protein GKR96_11285 [Gammaproteobacteria bacterium]|nr:hypothetical protein [Gammaproteobacteria bacterium]
MREIIQEVVKAVQHNCDVADARYAGEDPLCVYLMKMRDFFRWSEGVSLGEPVDRNALGDWIVSKETAWDELEEAEFQPEPIVIDGQEFNRFDNAAINKLLIPQGYIYSGGLGRQARPIYFLGELVKTETTANATIWVSGRELSRCVVAPPAMSQLGAIIIRSDSLKRYLASMVEEWSWKKGDNAMGEVVSHYNFETDFHGALNAMVDNEMENLILHEIGERIAEELIGEGWQEMIANLPTPLQEMKARAVRDNLADCTVTLPAFLTFKDRNSMNFYYANMTPIRKELFPSFCSAYENSLRFGDVEEMTRVINRGRQHWVSIGKQLVRSNQKGEAEAIRRCLESSGF